MSITIANDSIVKGSWGSVDKTSLGKKLAEDGSSKAIHEAYLFVGDKTKRSTWKFPHHVLQGNTLKVHASGVHAAAQRLVSSGVTASDIPKKAAAKHLMKHYKAMAEEAPESLKDLAKSLTVKELEDFIAEKEAWIYDTKSEDTQDLADRAEHINDILEHLEDELNELRDVLEELLEEESNEEDEEDMDEKSLKEFEIQEIIKSKSLNVQYKGGLLSTTYALAFDGKGINTDVYDAVETGDVAPERKGNKKPRTLENYRATEEELAMINSYSGIDLTPQECFVFPLKSADAVVDRGYEKFHVDALKDMADMSLNKPVLMDHNHAARNQVGNIFSAGVTNKSLRQKAYFLNIDENYGLIKNIAAGIYNKVSVGFGIALQDFCCDLCNTPMISKNCPHMPGQVDQNSGKTATATIKRVKDFYEVSIVSVPMQPAARIGRSMDSDDSLQISKYIGTIPPINIKSPGTLTLSISEEKLRKSLDKLQKMTASTNANKELDRILNEKQLISGDHIVDTPTDQETSAADTSTEVTAVAKTNEEVVAQTKPTLDPVAAKSTEEMLIEAVTCLTQSMKSLKKEIKKLGKKQKTVAQEVNALVQASGAQVEAISKAAGISQEQIVRSLATTLVSNEDPTKPAESFGHRLIKAYTQKENK